MHKIETSIQSVLPASIATLAADVVTENIAAKRKVTVAESCTGGLVSAALTEVAGSSAAFGFGFVTYANAAKVELVGVDSALLDKHGAVSIEVVCAMAQGALARSGADVAVAISGVAGPDGGSQEKPVGTVVFARALKGEPARDTYTIRKEFGADKSRAEIRMAATHYALELLLPPDL